MSKSKREPFDLAALESLLGRASAGDIGPEDGELVARLARFAIRIEKTRNRPTSERRGKRAPKSDKPGRGHGRNGAADYPGATRVPVDHPDLAPGDPCPDCGHPLHEHGRRQHVHLTGSPTVTGTIYERQVLRCSTCGKTRTAPAPDGVGEEKFDASADAATAVDKYGRGVPFYRQAQAQAWHGVPVPASTQWDRAEALAGDALAIFLELELLAASAPSIGTDDTSARILSCIAENQRKKEGERTGVFTTCQIARVDGHEIVLFHSGRRHSGENLAILLGRRAGGLSPPILMCDASSTNTATNTGDVFEAIVSNCLAHGRGKFIGVESSFPDECRHVLEAIGAVYHNDKLAKQASMTPSERLAFHRQHSLPVMDALREWMKALVDERQVEPNGGLGRAINYMLKRWDRMTRFCEIAGADLDNNNVERALKMAVLNRKNALFFRTEAGAWVSDVLMSLIQTAVRAGADPYRYLTAIKRNAADVRANPSRWVPWNWLRRIGPA